MLRILHVTSSMNRGGIETFLMNVYRKIDKNKIQFDFLLNTKENCSYNEEIKQLGGRIYSITPRKKNYFRYKKELNQFFRDHPEYTIVHQHVTYLGNITPIRIAKKTGVKKTILHSHSTGVTGHPINHLLHRLDKFTLSKYADYVFACSDLAAKWVLRNKDYNQQKYTKVMNGIDIKRFIYNKNTRNNIRNKLGLTGNYVIGHVGRLSYEKNHQYLIDTFLEVVKIKPDSVLVLVGEGELKKEIVQLVDKKKLRDHVVFLDSTSNVHELYQAFDAFVFPSHYEGLGMVLIEAQTSGLPVYASKDVIPNEVNITGAVRFIHLDYGPKYWAEQIAKTNEYNREADVERIKKSGYDIDLVTKRLQTFYLD